MRQRNIMAIRAFSIGSRPARSRIGTAGQAMAGLVKAIPGAIPIAFSKTGIFIAYRIVAAVVFLLLLAVNT